MRILNSGDYVRVYRNLHKKTYSIQKWIDGRWLVVKHADNFFLRNVSFVVKESGRRRVLRDKRKNAHAFICGFYYSKNYRLASNETLKTQIIRYDPYKMGYFFDIETNCKVNQAFIVAFFEDGVKAINIEKVVYSTKLVKKSKNGDKLQRLPKQQTNNS